MRTLSYFLVLIACVAAMAAGRKTASAQGLSQIGCHEVAVVGAVRTPTRLKIQRPPRLRTALIGAGGPTERAGKVVRVVHFCKCSPCNEGVAKAPDANEYNLTDVLRGEAQANPEVAAGDLVVVTETEMVFFMGNVLSQKSLVFREGLTLSKAIASAGVGRNSEAVRIRIHRHPSAGPRPNPFIFALKAILQNQSDDPVLQPNDIVEVSDETGTFRLPKTRHPWDPPSTYPSLDPPLFPRKSSNC